MEKDKITEMMIKELGEGWPSEVGIFPIIAEGRVAAMFLLRQYAGRRAYC